MLAASSITELRKQLLAREISPRDIVLDVAKAIEVRNQEVGAYVSWDIETALAEADAADITKPLGGVPVAVKDNINVSGQPCTCGSRILAENYRAPYDAGAVQLLRQGGAIPFGRLNMDEFAMGSSTENSAFSVTRNPRDLGRVPGGSSGGSAAAVAGDLAIAALGSDTGGSIRQPAALCGCVGIKPTYGRVSRFGLVAFASSLDQIGPLTKNVEDAALLLNHLCGHDAHDSTSLNMEIPDFTAAIGRDIKGMRVGLPKEYFIKGTHPGVSDSVQSAILRLESLGAVIEEISLPHTELGVATYYVLAPAEASANLARFDGVRYGHRSDSAGDLMDHYMSSRAEGFGPEVKRRILLGTYVLSSGYYDAYYIRAQKARTLIRDDFTEAFKKVDVIVSPTSPMPAHKLGELKDNPLAAYLEDIFTIPVNLAGLPGISVPCGHVEVEGASLPVGLQIIGKSLDETAILQVAHAVEQSL
jgi:aspartyl-tRNA(Asn)/glutamyl-tRNA(Gln) amidotransferase subunit A